MFIVTLTYLKPLEDIEPLMPAHMAWVRQGFEDGLFIGSGRRVPRLGGVILARSGDEQALRDTIARDPFVIHGAARCDIVEFNVTTTAPGAELLKSF